MKLVRIEPPGTWGLNQALLELISPLERIKTFIEVGPGEGMVSKLLCSKGLTGTGIDLSLDIIPVIEKNLEPYRDAGKYVVIHADVMQQDVQIEADLVFSLMVMEHIENDRFFLERLTHLANTGGLVLVGVPARQNKWGIEDEISGHYRRYERADLVRLFKDCGMHDVRVWSINVPISNILFSLSNLVIRRSKAMKRRELSRLEQTRLSGFKDVPGKTLFPPWCSLFLNKYTMYPLFCLQRLFYYTNAGLTLIGCGTKGSVVATPSSKALV